MDTERSPNIMSATASFQRVGLANAAGTLDLAIYFADTFQTRNSVEKAVCHQPALLHRLTMRTGAELTRLEGYLDDVDAQLNAFSDQQHTRLLSEIPRIGFL